MQLSEGRSETGTMAPAKSPVRWSDAHVQSEEELQSVFKFASQDPEIRTRLLVAVIDAANKNSWSPQLGPVQGSA
jgi:hypothetical protein